MQIYINESKIKLALEKGIITPKEEKEILLAYCKKVN